MQLHAERPGTASQCLVASFFSTLTASPRSVASHRGNGFLTSFPKTSALPAATRMDEIGALVAKGLELRANAEAAHRRADKVKLEKCAFSCSVAAELLYLALESAGATLYQNVNRLCAVYEQRVEQRSYLFPRRKLSDLHPPATKYKRCV
jgi:hypothetical protein